MNRDVLAGVGLLVLAGLYYAATQRIQDSGLSDEIGAAGLPVALAALLAGLAALLVIRGLATARPIAAAATADPDAEPPAGLRRALGLLALGGLYVALAPVLGYVAALAVLIAAVATFEGARPGWRLGAVALAGGGLFWLVFVWLLGVEQPRASWF